MMPQRLFLIIPQAFESRLFSSATHNLVNALVGQIKGIS
jgi:hypothetical protein